MQIQVSSQWIECEETGKEERLINVCLTFPVEDELMPEYLKAHRASAVDKLDGPFEGPSEVLQQIYPLLHSLTAALDVGAEHQVDHPELYPEQEMPNEQPAAA